MADKQICQTVATKAAVTRGNSINIMGLEMCSTGWGKFTVQLLVVRYLLEWKTQWTNVQLIWYLIWRG